MNFIDELEWRGLLQDFTEGVRERLDKGMVTGYVGFDPTAKSLTIGNLVPLMMLVHLQRAGHKPLAVVGGATGMIGDPSGKSAERKLLSKEQLEENKRNIRDQLAHYLNFEEGANRAELIDNYDWYKDMNVLEFLRDVGKNITISYMMSKESVKRRLEEGISFTEFSYQLLQGYDYHHLRENMNCELQMGGSDQWGNILTGTEFIRRISGKDAYGVVCPLLTREDGSKFGKSEGNNVWLDPEMTSPYHFYQFWINATDTEASRYIRIFTTKTKEEIENLEAQHAEAPHQRLLQKALAEDITERLHGKENLKQAEQASEFLFGRGTKEMLFEMDQKTLQSALEGVPQYEVSKEKFTNGIPVADLLAEETQVLPSKGEVRRTIKGGGLSINKEKITDQEAIITENDLVNGNFLLVQRGKKNYYLILAKSESQTKIDYKLPARKRLGLD